MSPVPTLIFLEPTVGLAETFHLDPAGGRLLLHVPLQVLKLCLHPGVLLSDLVPFTGDCITLGLAVHTQHDTLIY